MEQGLSSNETWELANFTMTTTSTERDDASDCSVCTDVFADPRVLPCGHTYCLTCIRGWARDRLPGDKLACPLCRQECIIPDKGVEGLPVDILVDQVVRTRKLAGTTCDMCAHRAESGATPINSATRHCSQCRENYCELCADIHRKQKASRDHELLQIGDAVKPDEDVPTAENPEFCDRHVDEALTIYCVACKLVICTTCYVEDHGYHKRSTVNEVAESFRRAIPDYTRDMLDASDRCEAILQTMLEEKHRLGEQVPESERVIRAKTQQLKLMLDRHEESLLDELKSKEQKRTKEIETAHEEVERQMALMYSCAKYIDRIGHAGTACDLARAAGGLQQRADELLISDVAGRTLDGLGHADLAFTASNYVPDDSTKTVGLVQINNDKAANVVLRLTHALPGNAGVYAVASLGDRLFAVRQSKNYMEVCDSVRSKSRSIIRLPEYSCPTGIATCPVNNCVYLTDNYGHKVCRLDLSSDRWSAWSVGRSPGGLSVTADRNVLVCCCDARKLEEYTTDGRLVREICVGLEMHRRPWHAVKLRSCHYLVSHGPDISVVGVDGRVVRKYVKFSSGTVRETNLAVTRRGHILAPDCSGNRILAIDSSLTRQQQLRLPAGVHLTAPCAVHLDESRGRLCIGEFGGQNRVVVLDDFTARFEDMYSVF